MSNKIFRHTARMLANRQRRHIWWRIVGVLSCVVVFVTTYALILPAITLERQTKCGKMEHTHTETCYTQQASQIRKSLDCSPELHQHLEDCYDEYKNLVCGYADFVVHEHTADCYDAAGNLLCPLQEIKVHTHDESCYTVPDAHVHGQECYTQEKGELICTESAESIHTHTEACYSQKEMLACEIPEGDEHHHGDGCYETVSVLACGQAEDAAHVHTDACYTWSEKLICEKSTEPGERVLTCDKEEILLHEHTQEDCFETDEEEEHTYLVCDKLQILEHVHTDACFQTVEVPVDATSLTCGMAEGEGHKHSDKCYGIWELTCQVEEHTHTLACQADSSIDVETEEIWKNTLPAQLTGVWADDLLAVAESQLGYTQSEENFQVAEDGFTHLPYSRYGAWYGKPYENWNSLFVMFCLHYAEIPETNLPLDSDPAAWVEKLAGRAEGYEAFQLYRSGEDYTPLPGDLVFLDLDEDETADRVGIVTAYTDAVAETPAALETVEGDVSGKVSKQSYPLDGAQILGYAEMPEKPRQEKPLLCGKEEHTHTELCSSVNPDGSGLIITCGREEHTHTEQCYVPQQREYRYEDEAILVTVVLPAGSLVPENASLQVTPITQAEERYSLLERQAQAAVDGEMRQLVLYDVSFYTQEGEYLPVEESAAVTIAFKQELLSGDQVEVIHYGQEDSTPVALEGVEVHRGENEALSGIAFQTNGFSVFGVMTTVTAEASTSSDITLYPGQIYTVDEVNATTATPSVDGVVDAQIKVHTDDILKIGIGNDDYLYSGPRKNIRDALYTFNSAGQSNQFTIHHNNIYLNFKDASNGRLSSNSSDTILIQDHADDSYIPEGSFALSSTLFTGNNYLFFHGKNENPGSRYGFDLKPQNFIQWGGSFLLFREAPNGESGSEVIPGFVQVTQKSDIQSGNQYLIVAKAQDRNDYYVLYPNLNAGSRYEHTARIFRYSMTLTAENAGSATVTAGGQTWNVTVNDQLEVTIGRPVSIQLPAGAAAVVDNESFATIEVDANGLATVTGVAKGDTTATITANGQTYTWHIHAVKPTSFQVSNKNTIVTFHLRNKNTGEPLEMEQVSDITAADATKYLLVAADSAPEETANEKNIVVPQVENFQFLRATYNDHLISSFATTGYDYDGNVVDPQYSFRFYTSPSDYFNINNSVHAVDVYLDYMDLPLATTVSPSGTTLNLFDYWVNSEDEGQAVGDINAGINLNHPLHFTTSANGTIPLNRWTGSANVHQGIVANQLGDDGYPYLSGADQGNNYDTTESLGYLFNPAYSGPSADYRRTYQNVSGLLQINPQGYYYYDSTENYAEFDRDTKRFNLYPDWAIKHDQSGTMGQFFPFAPYSTVNRTTEVPRSTEPGKLNHYFGMTMSTRFVQQHGGHTGPNNDIPMTFEFSGDDDVWIFIDDVLVADLGGIHDAANVKIDFAAGTAVINKDTAYQHTTSFSTIFGSDQLVNGTFPDNSYHTLKFYYLERGGVASNLHLKFNLVMFPTSGITKVDQVGDPIQGAQFKLYRTGADYIVPAGAVPICQGTTGVDGEFIFVDSNGDPMTLQELYKDSPYYVLKETHIPAGYRGTGADIHLMITKSDGSSTDHISSYVMTCTNTRDCGAFASTSLQVTASNILYLDSSKDPIIPGQTPGALFAIVMKYTGPAEGKDQKALENEDNWSPVYGTAETGYTIVDRKQYPSITDAVNAAKDKYPGHQNFFRRSSSGTFQALIEDLPGNIGTYSFMAGYSDPEKVQYAVSYYWTDAAGTTKRVEDYTTSQDGSYSFTRVFGTDIHVPNMVNRIAVQKLDEDNVTPINGAAFAMYQVQEVADKQYYVAIKASDKSSAKLFLEPDADGDYNGIAWAEGDPSTKGRYTVTHEGENIGTITVTIPEGGGETYSIKPFQVKTTSSTNNYQEEGIAEFEKMVSGKYFIRELTAPAGYGLNPNHVMVLVTDNAIYANAGSEDDGIAVSRGPGYLAGNLHYYASFGEIENTLTWVYTQMKVSPESTKFSDVSGTGYTFWNWVQTRRDDAYEPGAPGPTPNRSEALTAYLKYITPGTSSGDSETSARFSYAADENLYKPAGNPKRKPTVSANVGLYRRLYTKTGWSYLEVLQDFDYGKIVKHPNADYADWSKDANGNPDDLSNLFSRSIYVHVTDPKLPADLEITKTVQPGENVDAAQVPQNADFTFTVTLTQNGSPLTGPYSYQVYDVDESGNRTQVGETKTLNLTDGVGNVTLQDRQAVVIRGIPVNAAYTIVETNPGKGYTVTAVEKVWKNGPATESYDGGTVSGSMYWHVQNGELDNLSKVDFTNTYDPYANTINLSVRKVDSTNHSRMLSGAEFTLKNEAGKYYSSDEQWVDAETKFTTGADGKLLFTGIKEGTYILTETKAPVGYNQLRGTIKIVVKDRKITATADGAPCIVESDDVTLTVPNSSGRKLPETGGAGTSLYTTAGLLLMICAVFLLQCKKHCITEKRRESISRPSNGQ